MTSPIIVERTAETERFAAAKAAEGATYPVCPRATAVAAIFVDKLNPQWERLDAVPLEELVTPATLEEWSQLFSYPDARAALAKKVRNHHPVIPPVWPQPDGSVVVMLAWVHPDQREAVPAPRAVSDAYKVTLRLVENPDDWRVERID